MGDHERSDTLERASTTTGADWGGESSHPYTADPSTVVTIPALLLSRGDKERGR